MCPGDAQNFYTQAVDGSTYTWDMDYNLELASYTTPAINQIYVRAKIGFTGGYVYLTLGNACGSANRIQFYVSKGSSCRTGYSYTYSPNPANNELTVNYNETPATPNPANNETTTQNQTADNTGQSTTVSPAADSKTQKSFSAELYNNKGKAIRSGKNGSNSKIVFNTQDIPNGNYFLHIIDGKEVTKKQVIIQHQ